MMFQFQLHDNETLTIQASHPNTQLKSTNNYMNAYLDWKTPNNAAFDSYCAELYRNDHWKIFKWLAKDLYKV